MAVAQSLLTEDLLRSSAWRRLHRGVYADATLPDGPGTRTAGAALILLEYDGAVHADVAQMRCDRRRSKALLAAGWVVLHVTVADPRGQEALVRRVREVQAARRSPEVGA